MPCYLVIYGKKQEMDEDIFDQMVEALNPETDPRTPNPNLYKMETGWNLWQANPLRPKLFFKIL